MKRILTRKSIVVSAGGMLAAGLLATTAAATAANAATVKDAAPAARGPAWHTILSAANGRTPSARRCEARSRSVFATAPSRSACRAPSP